MESVLRCECDALINIRRNGIAPYAYYLDARKSQSVGRNPLAPHAITLAPRLKHLPPHSRPNPKGKFPRLQIAETRNAANPPRA